MASLTKYQGTSGTARKASGAVLLGTASRCIACVPPISSRAARGGSPKKALELPTRRGPSISARAPFARGNVAGLDQAGAAHGIEQCQAVNVGGAAVDRAHGAGGTYAAKFKLAGYCCRVHAVQYVSRDQAAQLIKASGNLVASLEADKRPRFVRFVAKQILAGGNVVMIWGNADASAVDDDRNFEVHFRSFLTTLADYSSGVICAYKAAQISCQAACPGNACEGATHAAKASCQDIKYARSGRAADAVREHSLLLSRSRREAAPLPSRSPSLFLSMLTPARLDAMNMARQFSAPAGVGWTVPARTIQNQRQNQQPIEILRFCASVLGFSGIASRHVRVGACVGVYTHMHTRKARTSEPSNLYVLKQVVSGSLAVLTWFWPEPATVACLESVAISSFPIKIVGRYCVNHAQIGLRGLVAVEGGRKVWAFSPSASPISRTGQLRREVDVAIWTATAWAWLDDGFLRVCEGAAGHVGTVRLERWPVQRSNASFQRPMHLPIRMAETTPWARTGHPPLAPFRRRAPSSSLALERGRILIGYRAGSSRINLYGSLGRRGEAARKVRLDTGPGEGWGSHLNPRSTGWGRKVAAGKLHRFRQAIEGAAHVN